MCLLLKDQRSHVLLQPSLTFFSSTFLLTTNSQWLMQFDANPSVINELNKRLKVDPRVLRHAVIRLGSKLEDIVVSAEKTGTKV